MIITARWMFIILLLLFAIVILFINLPVNAEEDDNPLTALIERVDELFERVAALEAVWEGPGPVYGQDGQCILATSGAGGPSITLQHETILKYMTRYDSLPPKSSLFIVQGDPETGETHLFYRTHGKTTLYVIESWQGCEFRGSSEWMAAEG